MGPKRIGPVQIIKKIGSSAYRLDLPKVWKIHPVFHISLLTPWEGLVAPGPEALEIDQFGSPQYEVKAILQQRKVRRKTQYLVEWLGYHPEEASWQDAEDCVGCEQLIKEFHAKVNSKIYVLPDSFLPKLITSVQMHLVVAIPQQLEYRIMS